MSHQSEILYSLFLFLVPGTGFSDFYVIRNYVQTFVLMGTFLSRRTSEEFTLSERIRDHCDVKRASLVSGWAPRHFTGFVPPAASLLSRYSQPPHPRGSISFPLITNTNWEISYLSSSTCTSQEPLHIPVAHWYKCAQPIRGPAGETRTIDAQVLML